MAEPMILTDANLDSVLRGKQPALILISNGDGLCGEFISAFKKAADEQKHMSSLNLTRRATRRPRCASM